MDWWMDMYWTELNELNSIKKFQLKFLDYTWNPTKNKVLVFVTSRRCFTEVSSGWRTYVLLFHHSACVACDSSCYSLWMFPLQRGIYGCSFIDWQEVTAPPRSSPSPQAALVQRSLLPHPLFSPCYMNSKSLLQTDFHFSSSDPVVAAHCSPSIIIIFFNFREFHRVFLCELNLPSTLWCWVVVGADLIGWLNVEVRVCTSINCD